MSPTTSGPKQLLNILYLLAKLEKRSGALLLFLPPVNVHYGDINVVEQLGVELDGVARGEENLYYNEGGVTNQFERRHNR